MKRNKNLIIIVLILISVIIAALLLFNNSLVIKDNKDKLKSEYYYTCSYNEDDGFKSSIYRYEIETDSYNVITNVKSKIILDYTKEVLYQEAKKYYQKNDFKVEVNYDDNDKDITIHNHIDQNNIKNKSYTDFITTIDKKYVCDEIKTNEIVYECIKTEDTNDYTGSEIHTISSYNNMNIESINKKIVLKYKNEILYLESKKNYQTMYEKKYNDKDKSVIYDYAVPIKDKDGNSININIKKYIDSLGSEYVCKIK